MADKLTLQTFKDELAEALGAQGFTLIPNWVIWTKKGTVAQQQRPAPMHQTTTLSKSNKKLWKSANVYSERVKQFYEDNGHSFSTMYGNVLVTVSPKFKVGIGFPLAEHKHTRQASEPMFRAGEPARVADHIARKFKTGYADWQHPKSTGNYGPHETKLCQACRAGCCVYKR